jgi:hypothetical protein
VQTSNARLWGLSSVLTVLIPALATAAPVAPGGSVEIDTFENPPVVPAGPALAEQTIPFTLNYPLPAGADSADPAPTTTGSLTQSVFRNTTGGLTFVYDMTVENETEYVDEFSRLTVGSFANVSTDITGSSANTNAFRGSRSADGATITSLTSDGLGGAPLLIVDTDATAFDQKGTATYLADAEFVINGPGFPEGDQVDITTRLDFTNLFQPAADTGPGPTPVPLPPALWAALLTTGVLGAGAKARRVLRNA